MKTRDVAFAVGALVLSGAVPALLVFAAPFAEARQTLGIVAGWALALLVMLPSHLLTGRVLDSDDPHVFLRGFMLGTGLRFGTTIVAAGLFAWLVPEAPLKAFLVTFLLGYVAFTGLELLVSVRRPSKGLSA